MILTVCDHRSLRSAALVLLLAISIPCWSDDCPAQLEYDALTAKATEKFYDRTFRGLDWNTKVGHYRKQVGCHDNKEKVAAVANRLLAELHTSHTGVYTSTDLDYWALQSIYSRSLTDFEVPLSGIWPERRDNQWYVKYVLPGSPAETEGISAGDRLISIDSKAFDPLGFKNEVRSELVISPDGKKRRTVSIAPKMQSVQQMFLDASERSKQIFVGSNYRIGYYHLWAGTHESFLRSLEAALTEFETERVGALILDLRGGYGGASIDYLKKLKSSTYLTSIPKFVLIDDGVRSGKELLAATLRHEQLATLIGSRTAGAFLGASPVRLFDNKYLLYVPVGAWFPPEIGPIEGGGVEPDIAVTACKTFCGGDDTQLREALERAKHKIASAAPRNDR